jgi:hypothetical protein
MGFNSAFKELMKILYKQLFFQFVLDPSRLEHTGNARFSSTTKQSNPGEVLSG